MSETATLAWFARHEARLAWRDWVAMIAGRRRRQRTAAVLVIVFLVGMHLLALAMVGRFADLGPDPDKVTLVVITGSLLLSWFLMMSQAMESVTRAFYARADLDLILSSPIEARKVFAVRIAATALSVTAMAMVLAAPFINVLAIRGGPHWLDAYGVVFAMGVSAAAVAVAATIGLFRLIGPKRTRLIAQIVAAVIGAAFVIGLQIVAILSYGTLSRLAVLESDDVVALAPDVGSVAWWPARAVLGDPLALAIVVAAGLAALLAVILIFSARFGEHVLHAAGISQGPARQRAKPHGFRRRSPASALRRKEWTLLRRDPWLVSQTLMQVLYLVPPALLLWRSFSNGTGALFLLVPVLVMAAGQLAGGLAWLAISGEDAPDLVITAPVPASLIQRAKIEAVLGVIAIAFVPFVVALAFVSIFAAAVCACGVLIAAASATAIQLWFRAQAKRSHFRRRQTSSRIATFAEAFASIGWAATAGLLAAGTSLAAIPGVMAILVLALARLISPSRRSAERMA